MTANVPMLPELADNFRINGSKGLWTYGFSGIPGHLKYFYPILLS
jgi:hypothetical protein